LPADAFANPAWNALHSTHRELALTAGLACKYPREVAPFAALAENTLEALRNLHSLLEPGETTCVIDPAPPQVEGLQIEPGPVCLQMSFPPNAPLPQIDPSLKQIIAPLTCAAAAAMVALTDVAFRGYFRPRTCVMGNYYGVRDPDNPGRLIAMAGERMCPFPFREVSGVCTHPDHRGHGYAAALIAQVLEKQRSLDALSTLWVVNSNEKAIDLYLRLGFYRVREVQLHRVTRDPSPERA
jgi:GNAT superfamily N-acetyltransferase